MRVTGSIITQLIRNAQSLNEFIEALIHLYAQVLVFYSWNREDVDLAYIKYQKRHAIVAYLQL